MVNCDNIPVDHHYQPNMVTQGGVDPYFIVVVVVVRVQLIETHQICQKSFLLLSNFSKTVWIVASVFCFQLTRVAPSVVLCSPPALRFKVFQNQKWSLLTLVVKSGKD